MVSGYDAIGHGSTVAYFRVIALGIAERRGDSNSGAVIVKITAAVTRKPTTGNCNALNPSLGMIQCEHAVNLSVFYRLSFNGHFSRIARTAAYCNREIKHQFGGGLVNAVAEHDLLRVFSLLVGGFGGGDGHRQIVDGA